MRGNGSNCCSVGAGLEIGEPFLVIGLEQADLVVHVGGVEWNERGRQWERQGRFLRRLTIVQLQ